MLKWCSYCQQFLTESPPYELLVITHGMCDSCKHRGFDLDEATKQKLEQLVALQRDLYSAGGAGDVAQIGSLIDRARRFGVKPLDIILGFLNPMLVRIGSQWEEGTLTVREEHLFTQFCEALLVAVQSSQPDCKNGETPSVLLTSADGNYHCFGVRVVHLWLSSEGITSELITPGLPAGELLEYTNAVKPLFVGISLSMRSQLPGVRTYLDLAVSSPMAPEVLVGGYAVKSQQVTEAELSPARLVHDFRDLLAMVSVKRK
jgi:methanogenic corrinoid protein MtbC1